MDVNTADTKASQMVAMLVASMAASMELKKACDLVAVMVWKLDKHWVV